CERVYAFFFFSSRRRHTRLVSDWSSDVCSSDLVRPNLANLLVLPIKLRFELGSVQPSVGRGRDHVQAHVHTDLRCFWDRVGDLQIGRASCREGGRIGGAAESVNKKGERGHE